MKMVQELSAFHIKPNQYHPLQVGCFNLWKKVWVHTFADLNVPRELDADDFLDRDIFGISTPTGEICGFMLIRSFYLNECSIEHSYFKNYPHELKRSLSSSYENAMVISYMTIADSWRKSYTDIALSELIMGLCVDHFRKSDSFKLFGYFRNNRKTNEIFYRHGGVPIKTNEVIYNVFVDLSYMDKANARLSSDVPSKVQTLRFINQLQGEENGNPAIPTEYTLSKAAEDFSGDAMDR